MIEVELVGGEFDGLRFEVASEEDRIAVPLAFLGCDGTSPPGMEILEYERTGRRGTEGHPLYGFARQVEVTFSAGDAPPV